MRDPNEVFERVKQKVTHHKKRKMHRVCTILAVSIPITVIIIALGIRMWFGASKEKLQDSEGKTSIAHVTTPGVTVTSTPGGEYAKKEDNPTPHVVWAVHFTANISKENQAKVQAFLKEKGIDCRVDFVSVPNLVGDDYAQWLDERKTENQAPDILSSCVWQYGIPEAVEFLKKEFHPLDEFLGSNDGKALQDSYAAVEWKASTVEGKIYTIPLRLSGQRDTTKYIYVDNRYKEAFEASFDGTYESLRKIRDEIADTGAVIGTSGFGESLLQAFAGCSAVYGSCRVSTCSPVDLTREPEVKKLLQDIYSDYQNGVLVDAETPDRISGGLFAYVNNGRIAAPEGFTEYRWAPDLFKTAVSFSYGVLAASPRAELAMKVLSVCYSDPEIASLLSWQYSDGENWVECTAYLKTCKPTALTGFVPRLSEEQMKALTRYDEDLFTLCSMMQVNRGGKMELNSEFLSLLDEFYANPSDYGDVFEEINKQLSTWTKGKV